MKRIISVLLLTLVLCSCTAQQQEPVETTVKLRGVWLTSYELAPDSYTWGKAEYRDKLDTVCEKIKAFGLTDIFVQVRPNCDAFYVSELFPSSSLLTETQGAEMPFDALDIIISSAKAVGLRVHAWINPYRVSASNQDINALSIDNPARILYEQGDTAVALTDGGIYLNPANEQVQKLIIDGVREILSGYDVDGIHIDDYFYPSDDEETDKAEYSAYQTDGGTLSLADFRRSNVSTLVSGMYKAVKSKNEVLLFTVSPCGDIEKNYTEHYADVELWCSEDGYADYIIPQLYYGFENETKPFEQCINDWIGLGKAEKLCIGLASYKQGAEDLYAGSGKNEWLENSDIISRQITLSDNLGCSGTCLFSYSYLS